ncbi:molybdopterin molybdotransferase MoeA [Tundrisphaera sp. TA3]|uniref:molybdopterin molybdotransferase MoeA n=1 Tax=Tundrisphaera sp. TA3 TaxID=3435775 RepID=UPI003EBACD74
MTPQAGPIPVAEALSLVLARAAVLPPQPAALDRALGLILAEDIRADLDLPPFRKALVDGFAFRTADAEGPGEHTLRVGETILAGQTPSRPLEPGEAFGIMTGAPLPDGADAVAMVERVRVLPDGSIVLPGPLAPGANWMERGQEMKAGDIVIAAGSRLGPARLGVLASVGRATVLARPRPVVSVLSTGDELVPADRQPGPGQIRDSNSPTLRALARGWGASVRANPIAPDDPDGLRRSIGEALRWTATDPDDPGDADVLLISGGVSAGQKDLVPSTLAALGVEPVFHHVRVKPGKPLWFGVGPARGDRPGTLVFGLPGNPASGVVNFLLFVRPALDALSGRSPDRPYETTGRLAAPFRHRGDRPTYHPATIDGDRIAPLAWAGSADLRSIGLADGFAAFPSGDRSYEEGDAVGFLRF